MNPAEITGLSAAELARRVRVGELKAEDAARAFLSRVKELDPGIKAFLAVLEEGALAAAREVDRKVAAGRPVGRLAGVPVALKDNLQLKGVETTCASNILRGHSAPYDATVVERLKAEDAVLLGKTNLDEFAMGSSTENSAFFPTRNPWDLERVPGGSSGGSAAAVAARLAPLALGSDTGGSIRQPAAFCGVAGLKPSYGTVSRYGLVAFASSLDQIGPFARTVEDVALALSVIAGHDPRDSTSSPAAARDYTAGLEGDIKGLRIGLPREYFSEGLNPGMADAIRAAAEVFRELGAELSEVSLPHTGYALSAYYIIAPSEASANLARFDGIRYGHRAAGDVGLLELYEASRGQGFGPEVKRRIMLGTYALSSGYYDAYYLKAQKVRTLICRDFSEAFSRVDLLLTPTTPTVPFKFGEKADPLSMYLSDVYTIPCNMAGIGGMSIPCGTAGGLPLGMQLLCGFGEEARLLRAARRFEKARPFAACPEPGGGPVKTAAEVSAGGLVTRSGRILLIKMRTLRGELVWTFPKGHLKRGETPRQAALREVEEETGYRCEVRAPLALVRYSFIRGRRLVHKKVRWYWMAPLSGAARPQPGEIYGLRWLPFDRAEGLLRYPADFRLLAKARKASR